jgi:hypothetical protein
MAEVRLVGVERQNLTLGVALLDLDRDQNLFDFPFRAFLPADKADLVRKQIARELHGQGAGTRDRPASNRIDREANQHRRYAETEVAVEILVLGRDDGVAQVRSNLVVRDDEPALGRELGQRFSVRRVDARDGARRVVIQT